MIDIDKIKSIKYKDIKELLDSDTGMLWSMVAFVVVTFIWSIFFTLDIVSISVGSVIPSSKVKHIQHLEGGIVEQIKVKDGQTVSKDEPLVILSSISNKSDLAEISLRVLSIRADIYRLEAEAINAKSIAYDDEFAKNNIELVKRTDKLFDSRVATLESKISTQQKSIEEIETRLKNSIKRLKLVKEQIAIGEELIKEQLSNRYEHVDRLKEANTLESAISEDRVAIKKATQELTQIKRDHKEDIQTKLSEAKQTLKEFSQRVGKYEDSLDRTVIKSPMSGVIKRVNIATIGGVVKSGDTIVEIVPLDDKLIVEAKLLPQEVGHIQKNAMAFVQLDGSDGYRYGKVYGKVIHISPDSILTEESEAYFIVRIELDRDYFGDESSKIELFSGMQVSVGIVLGHRSLLEYIVSPFLANSSFTLSER